MSNDYTGDTNKTRSEPLGTFTVYAYRPSSSGQHSVTEPLTLGKPAKQLGEETRLRFEEGFTMDTRRLLFLSSE